MSDDAFRVLPRATMNPKFEECHRVLMFDL